MIISVFGGSTLHPGQPDYENARQLGYQLGSAGNTLLTGGYIGVMEAISRGGHEAGAHVIGATCAQIENWHQDRKPNPYLDEEWRYDTLKDRLFALVERCDAAIAMPGGAGTLAEISTMWNEMIIEAIPSRPLILMGETWRSTFENFINKSGDYVAQHDRSYLMYAPDNKIALEIIRKISFK